MDETILLTRDLMQHYHISRKTLWSWQSQETMPKGFARPFPAPDFPGNPNRWKSSSIKEWENGSRDH